MSRRFSPLSILLASAGVAAIAFSAWLHLRRGPARRLYDHGTRTQATVTARESRRIAYDYFSDGNTLHTVGLRPVPRSCAQRAEPGGELGLVYDPRDPNEHRLLCEQDLGQNIWPTIVLGGTGILLLIYAYRLVSTGQEPRAT